MKRLTDKDIKEKLTYNILKKFAKDKGWIEYRYDDGFWMFGPDDEETRKGVEEKHNEWITCNTHKYDIE